MFLAQLSAVDGARAQAPDPTRDGSPTQVREQAKVLFAAASADFAAGRYRDALRGFEQAARLLPSAELWFDIGRAHEELGELEAAVAALRRYLRDSVDPPDRVEVEARIGRLLEAHAAQTRAVEQARPTALLRLEVMPTEALVALDGTPIGRAPIDRWLSLGPGAHSLRVEHAGYVPSLAHLELEPGTVTVAQARLVKLGAGVEPARPRRRWTWVALGVGAAALVASAGLAVAASNQSDSDSADALASARNAMLGTGLGVAMLGALLYVVEGAHEARSVAAR